MRYASDRRASILTSARTVETVVAMRTRCVPTRRGHSPVPICAKTPTWCVTSPWAVRCPTSEPTSVPMAPDVIGTPSVPELAATITRASVTMDGPEMDNTVDGIRIWTGGRIMICRVRTGNVERTTVCTFPTRAKKMQMRMVLVTFVMMTLIMTEY
uniref:Uncharacterized protein n=1 Tax=Cacopsylla melanoneura TaxID=428564 RepID=A0A8D8XZF7_9HEMI